VRLLSMLRMGCRIDDRILEFINWALWERMHNVELHNLYSSPNTIRIIKS
jgi:hypothetical protein